MRSTWSRIDSFINWLEHGWFLGQVAGAIGLGKLFADILKMYTSIPATYISAIWWIATAFFMFLLTWGIRLLRSRKPPVIQTSTAVEKPQVQLKEIDNMYNANRGLLLHEVEESVRVEAAKYPNDEREAKLIQHVSTLMVVGFLEFTWYSIFGSQIRALEHLNKGVATLEDLKPYFSQESEKRPQYPFESWIGYLKHQMLIIQDGYNVNITVRGKDFLKYLVQNGRTANDKTF
jgi:hypothetical protein